MPSDTAKLAVAMETLAGKNPPEASPVLRAALLKAEPQDGGFGGKDPEGAVYAVDMGITDRPSRYAPKAGRSWRSVWYSLTVNTYRRDGKGSDRAVRLSAATRGVPVFVYRKHAWAYTTAEIRREARTA